MSNSLGLKRGDIIDLRYTLGKAIRKTKPYRFIVIRELTLGYVTVYNVRMRYLLTFPAHYVDIAVIKQIGTTSELELLIYDGAPHV